MLYNLSMQNKNLGLVVLCLVVGFLAGWLVFGNSMNLQSGEHIMSNGHSMQDDQMGMHDAMGDMMAGISGKTGDEFDKAFLEEMIVHHQGAVDMAQMVLQVSTRPELRTLAQDIISAQKKEIQMMQDWRAAWFK